MLQVAMCILVLCNCNVCFELLFLNIFFATLDFSIVFIACSASLPYAAVVCKDNFSWNF